MCSDSTGMWGWRQGCQCSPDPELKQPCWLCPRYNPACSRALGVLRLDSSLAGEADRLPHEWRPCQPFMGSLKFLSSATDAFLERPQFKVTCYKDTQHMKDLLLLTQNCFPLIHRSLFSSESLLLIFFLFFFFFLGLL